MSRKILAGVIAVGMFGFAAAALLANDDEDVTISGIAVDCYPEAKFRVGDVEVAVYDASTQSALADLLRAMDATDFSNDESLEQYQAQYEQLTAELLNAQALGTDTSAADGTFSVAVSPRDSVLVFGQGYREDEPYYFAWALTEATTSTHVELDLSSQCH